MEDLVGLNKPFKYVGEEFTTRRQGYSPNNAMPVSVVIMEQTGGGINTANSAYWDSIHDGTRPHIYMMPALSLLCS